jgi:hypothetical protein
MSNKKIKPNGRKEKPEQAVKPRQDWKDNPNLAAITGPFVNALVIGVFTIIVALMQNPANKPPDEKPGGQSKPLSFAEGAVWGGDIRAIPKG